ncbi:cytochrome P450 [Phytohabitans suffuscus]|uniref:Cytochrome P450 n=1 Tax=Phytohabitans suffuscus TaxID=624315 RepID=A0A6F8YUJ7_9ACTN|nr:cytochrome P450 [Phytohabitans suffuscus]BCB89792.1 cytochrome P450 [Phytohabitans suffuscus]
MATPTDLENLKSSLRRDYDPFATKVTIQSHLDEIADRRAELPVSYSAPGGGCWIVTTYDDISSVLRRNNRGFVSFPNEPPTEQKNLQGKRKRMIPIELDGSVHRQYRNLLDPLFAPGAVAKLEPKLRAAANHLIDQFIERGSCDFSREFALPYPGGTVMGIMGWPLEDMVQLSEWADIMMHGIYGATDEENNQARAEASQELGGYLTAMIAERRAAPARDDVTSLLLDGKIDGEPLPDDDVFDAFLLMVFAGLDTVQSALSQCMLYLGRHQDRWDEMFAGPDTLVPAIEELLRWTTMPVPTRTATETVEVGGIVLPAGERLHCPLGAANRDPRYFERPDEVIFDRPRTKPHIAFGVGPHRCLGSHLARLELRIGFEELRRRLPSFRIDPGVTPEEHLGMAWGVNNVNLLFPPGERDS